MKVSEQLHNSATHKLGTDPACPVCNSLVGVVADLERCARQNEADALSSTAAIAVAAEQRRMIRILRGGR